MKKLLLTLSIGLSAATATQAQVEIGLKVSPSLGYNRFTNPKDTKLVSEGTRVHFGGGIVLDYFFGENYAFATGLELMGKGGNMSYAYSFTDAAGNNVNRISSEKLEFGLQYLQVPVTLKLFTNDVAPDTRVYFQVGGELGGLIGARIGGEKTDANGNKFSKRFNTPEAGALLGAGAELQMGKSTKVFGGLSYHHGLTDISDKTFLPEIESRDIKFQNSYFCFDVGMKF